MYTSEFWSFCPSLLWRVSVSWDPSTVGQGCGQLLASFHDPVIGTGGAESLGDSVCKPASPSPIFPPSPPSLISTAELSVKMFWIQVTVSMETPTWMWQRCLNFGHCLSFGLGTFTKQLPTWHIPWQLLSKSQPLAVLCRQKERKGHIGTILKKSSQPDL